MKTIPKKDLIMILSYYNDECYDNHDIERIFEKFGDDYFARDGESIDLSKVNPNRLIMLEKIKQGKKNSTTNREYLGSMSIDEMFIAMLSTVKNNDCDAACLADYIAGKFVDCDDICGDCRKCIKKVLDMENGRKCNE